MFQDDRDIKIKEEVIIPTSIKRLAVKAENIMVSRITLCGLKQEDDEGIRNFTAHIKVQAELCNLVVACTCGINFQYTDSIVQYIIICSLDDQDQQQEILGHQDQDMSLDNILTLLEWKETGQKTQASILGETGLLGYPPTNHPTVRPLASLQTSKRSAVTAARPGVEPTEMPGTASTIGGRTALPSKSSATTVPVSDMSLSCASQRNQPQN
jgi:hypothetical protein